MSIHASYSVSCTNCNNQSPSDAESTPADALANAKAIGWKQFTVSNGSIWEICPRCLPKFEGQPGMVEVV